MPQYKVTIPYRDSKHREKRFKISYEVEAREKREAMGIAKKRFNEFLTFQLASWVRTMFEDEVAVVKIEKGQSASDELINELCLLLKSGSEEVRTSALDKLKDLEDERAVPVLLDVFMDSLEPEKQDLIATLLSCGSAKTGKQLTELYGDETSPRVKASLIKTIGKLGSRKVIGFMEQALAEDDTRVRANAIEALEEIGGDEAFAIILGAVEDSDNRVKANAIRAIYRLKGLFLDEALREMLQHHDSSMKKSAAFAAGEMCVPEVINDLEELLRDPDEEVRAHAVRALGKIRGVESLEILLAALVYYYQSGDEKLLTAVRESIIYHPAQDVLPDILMEALSNKSEFPSECVDEVLLEFLKKEKQRGQTWFSLRWKRWFNKLFH